MRITKKNLKVLIETFLNEQEEDAAAETDTDVDAEPIEDTDDTDGVDDADDTDGVESDAEEEAGSFEKANFVLKLENGKNIKVVGKKENGNLNVKIKVDGEDMTKSFNEKELSALVYARLIAAINEGREELKKNLIMFMKEIQTDLEGMDDEKVIFKLKNNARRFHLQWFKDIVERLS